MAETEKDALTGKATTGHEWDGIRELNTPIPGWWRRTFYACILWSIGYWVLYPAWPGFSSYTKGILGYSARGALTEELSAAKQSRSVWLDRFKTTPINDIVKDQELLNYAMAGGRMIFADNCAPCHGANGSGRPGFPVLADDDWLWGGALDDIKTTITFGIRSAHADARSSEMPAFIAVAEHDGKDDDDGLKQKDIEAVADYVMSLAKGGKDNGEGKEAFESNCSACHGEDGKGLQEAGAPNLTDGIWLHGAGRDAVIRQVTSPKHGVMPTWEGRLDEASIKQVAIYVHSLGGGK
ncbi:MAG: cytochrome-c oxidase, cbb3-type subunit III [Rhodospirillales bacterium RIFCSPLOWO2_12_FULL_58_28]|nr:MAG: cytochrome-c oxidase, cbb3-type subunit III [Rhodospirillales bacterium RIFCSPLOWO2_02_FULL_58_16]OHC76794.1 MAG: cytochrome-c oxidase, cbb3-type subunit III [Rhodospirillales bacterium RIFCSPLOWO2_12_FULL_58_28]